jgi:hypothetical protein
VLIINCFFTILYHVKYIPTFVLKHIHTYHSRFIPEGVAEVFQIFLLDINVLPKLAMRNTADVTGGKLIAVLL